jgi:hypothetical protein
MQRSKLSTDASQAQSSLSFVDFSTQPVLPEASTVSKMLIATNPDA